VGSVPAGRHLIDPFLTKYASRAEPAQTARAPATDCRSIAPVPSRIRDAFVIVARAELGSPVRSCSSDLPLRRREPEGMRTAGRCAQRRSSVAHARLVAAHEIHERRSDDARRRSAIQVV
jgi:hypothetical protein